MTATATPRAESVDAATETWRAIPGYEGFYEASTLGRIRSLDRTIRNSLGQVRTLHSRVLRPQRHSTKEYQQVALSKDGQIRPFLIHKLVAMAFIGPRPDGMQIGHRDGDPKNNAASNLSYLTPSENELDKWNHGTNREATRSHCRQGHPYDEANTYRCPRGWRVCRTCRNRASKAAPSRRRKTAA